MGRKGRAVREAAEGAGSRSPGRINQEQRKLSTEREERRRRRWEEGTAVGGCIAATNASPWRSTGVRSGVISPSQAAFYNDGPSATPGCVTPNLSPHYQDALPHGGFNPNNLYSRVRAPSPDGDPFTGRRGPVEPTRQRGPPVSVVFHLCPWPTRTLPPPNPNRAGPTSTSVSWGTRLGPHKYCPGHPRAPFPPSRHLSRRQSPQITRRSIRRLQPSLPATLARHSSRRHHQSHRRAPPPPVDASAAARSRWNRRHPVRLSRPPPSSPTPAGRVLQNGIRAAFYNDGPSATPGCVTPNLSPHYQDALPHGGFNPNNLYSPAYEQRRPRGGEEEDDEGAGDDDLVEVDADGVRTKKKKKKASGTRGPKWTVLEDLCLCESWATVSHDSIIGANQKIGKYWVRIKAEFDERKLINSDYQKVPMKRSQKAMSTRWAIIQASVNSFHGYHHDLETRGDSGADVAKLFDRAMDLYAKNSEGHKSFVLMHCYGKLKMNEKWRLTRLSLPTGNKAAKAALADAASSEKTQASITKCLADVSSTFISRDKKADQRWAELLKRQEEKLELKKRRDDMSLLRTSIEGMSPRTRAAHNFFKGQILDDIEAKMAAATRGPGSGIGGSGSAKSGASSATPASACVGDGADAPCTATGGSRRGHRARRACVDSGYDAVSQPLLLICMHHRSVI
ncbi:hypothetical protein QYE76_031250 [Lolium multiflorum]|uniref:No apical meristem-associated C-terminal domain-containing protein n=1 Tax=Lolium multiflorum TaxID=4521 RepID=A0AAD8VH82_LOLMU|nr:hypothetical protein QYE76_031250 [Lolium multiflorum]